MTTEPTPVTVPEAPRLDAVTRVVALVDAELARIGNTADPVTRQREAGAATEQIRDAMNELLARSTAIRSGAVAQIYTDLKNWRKVGETIGCTPSVAYRIAKYGRAGGRR